MRKMINGIAAVLAVSALMAGSAVAGTPKLEVKDSLGTTSVFKVENDGITTITNKTAADTNYVFKVKDLSGTDTLYFSPNGFLEVGSSRGQVDVFTYAGDSTGTLPGVRPVMSGARARGSQSSPLAVRTNDKLGTFTFSGYDGAAWQAGALMEVFVDGTPTATTTSPAVQGTVPSRISIVTGTNSANRAERLVIKSDGKIGMGTNAPTSQLQVVGLPVYADNATATAAGLTPGAFYRTSTGVLMVVYTP